MFVAQHVRLLLVLFFRLPSLGGRRLAPQGTAKQILVHSQIGIRKYLYLTDSKKLTGASRRRQVFQGTLKIKKAWNFRINFNPSFPLLAWLTGEGEEIAKQ